MLNYINKKVVIMGLGQIAKGSGVSAALFFASQKAKVTVTDIRKVSQLNSDSIKKLKKYKNIKFVFGRHRLNDFIKADLIIKNPAVKPNSEYIKIAKKNNVPVSSDLEIFFDNIKNEKIKTIGITGTRGKSTSVALVYEILKSKYKNKVHLGGNIGNSPLNFLKKLKANHIVVLEIASFQLNQLKNYHFDIAAVTNILPDHLDYYKTMKQYQADKEKIFATQTKQDYLFLNKQDKKTKAMAKRANSKIVFFSKTNKIKLSDINLLGQHNLFNISLAWKIAQILKVPETKIKKVVINFKGVKDRLEFVRDYKGIKIYNDTTATHPKATVVALQALPKNKIILISGGNSKNISLTELSKEIKNRVKNLILMPGNANKQLPEGIEVTKLTNAIKKALILAKKGDYILFSPGLTWLPIINEFDRGKEFVNIIEKL